MGTIHKHSTQSRNLDIMTNSIKQYKVAIFLCIITILFMYRNLKYGRDRRGTIRGIIDGEFDYDRKAQIFPKIEEIEKM